MEYYSVLKRIKSCHRWVLEGIMLSEISQKKTNTIRSHLHEEPKQTKNKLRYRKQTGGCQRWAMGIWWSKNANFHL